MSFRAYLSGPMRGIERFNADAFDEAADWLRSHIGWSVISPVEMDRDEGFDLDGPEPDDEWVRKALARDLDVIARCDAVVLLPGWEDSEGAKAEVRCAIAGDKQLYVLRGTEKASDIRPLSHDDAAEAVFIAHPDELAEAIANPVRWTDTEERVIDPETGGAKGQKLAQLGAVCPKALMEVASVAGFGAQKYERYNFLRGYRWSLSYDACQRHLNAFWSGEDNDPESGFSHLAHAAWHCLAMLAFVLRRRGTDDRPVC